MKHFSRKSARRTIAWKRGLSWRSISLLTILGVLSVSTGLFIYQYNKHPTRYPAFASCWLQAKTWIAEHRLNLKHGLPNKVVKTKALAANNDEQPEIHFEFYNALPNMQMQVAERNDENIAVAPPIIKTKKIVTAFNAESLERDVSAQLKNKRK